MDYSEIVAASKSYVDRSDFEVSESMDVFIAMAEARINRKLKTYEQTHRVFTATKEDQEFYALPSDYNGMRSIQFNAESPPTSKSKCTPIEYVSPEMLIEMKSMGISESLSYTISGQQIKVYPTLPAVGSIEMLFYRKVPNLNSQNVRNWCSDNNPDIYLSGVCAEISAFVKDYDSAQLWDDRMTRAIMELKDSDFDKRWSGTPLVAKVIK